MKKITAVLLSLLLLLSFAGCGKSSMLADNSKTKTEEKQVNRDKKENNADSEDKANLNVDIDLTKYSKTMVYSEVQNMMQSPEKYIGKTIKMRGTCSVLDDAINHKAYYSCIIKDATACCAQGIEFELKGKDPKYPENYSEICVVGQFDTYMEDEYEYCTLRNAQLVD